MVGISYSQGISAFGRSCSVRLLVFLIALSGMAICSAWAQTPSLTMTATNPGGATNNGTAQLGVQVNLSTSGVNGATSPRAWTLQGAGTLTPSITAIMLMPPTCRLGHAGKPQRDHHRDHDCESHCLHLVYADAGQSCTGVIISASPNQALRGWDGFHGLDRDRVCTRNGL